MRGRVQDQGQDTVRGSRILVVCIGNDLIADDAIGHEVYRELEAQNLASGVSLHYAAVGGISLLDRLTGEESALIVVDAVSFGAPPGTVHCLNWDDIPSFNCGAISAHTIGLRETIEIGRLLYPGKMPSIILLVGVEGRCFDMPREAMSPEVAAALQPTVSCVQKHIHALQRGSQ